MPNYVLDFIKKNEETYTCCAMALRAYDEEKSISTIKSILLVDADKIRPLNYDVYEWIID